MATTEATTEAAPWELVIERVFDAPRQLVWDAWTQREHLLNWGAPHGYTVVDWGGDLRLGGAWHSIMRFPDGEEHRNGGIYREVTAPERLAYTYAWRGGDGVLGQETLVVVDLVEEGGKTRVTLRHSGFESVASRDSHGGGWGESLDRLADHVMSLAE